MMALRQIIAEQLRLFLTLETLAGERVILFEVLQRFRCLDREGVEIVVVVEVYGLFVADWTGNGGRTRSNNGSEGGQE